LGWGQLRPNRYRPRAAIPALATCASSDGFTPLTPTAPMQSPSFTIATAALEHGVQNWRTQKGHSAAIDHVFEVLAVAPHQGGSIRFGGRHVRGRRRSAIEAPQAEQVATLIDDRDTDRPTVLVGFGLCGGRQRPSRRPLLKSDSSSWIACWLNEGSAGTLMMAVTKSLGD